MKITNNTYIQNYQFQRNNRRKDLNFKGISPQSIDSLQKISKNIDSKKLFIKLSAIVGLTGILSWVNALTNRKNEDDDRKLDILNLIWTHRGNEYLLNPKSQDKYIDLVSKSDSEESFIFAKGLKKETKLELQDNEIKDEEAEMFLNPEQHDDFMSIYADNKIKTLKNFISTLSIASENQKVEFNKKVNDELSVLTKKIEELKKDEDKFAIYEKLANIVKTFSIINNLKANSNIDLLDNSGDITANNANDAENVENIENTENVENDNDYEKVDENAKFYDEILIPYFSREEAKINIDTYSENLDIIKDIYDSYSIKHEDVANSFLELISTEDINEQISTYKEFHNGKNLKIKFNNYYRLDNFIKENGGNGLTKEQFDYLHELKDNKIAFFDVVFGEKGDSIIISFNKSTKHSDKLKIISDIHKIAYNKTDFDLISDEKEDVINIENVAKDLGLILSRSIERESSDDYTSILNYLRIDEKIYKSKLKKILKVYDYDFSNKECYKLMLDTTIEFITKKGDKTRLKKLLDLLNNESFDGFLTSTHARMRFIARNVLSDKTQYNKRITTLTEKLEEEVQKLKDDIDQWQKIKVYNYTSPDGKKQGARVQKDSLRIGIDSTGIIHTFFYRNNI